MIDHAVYDSNGMLYIPVGAPCNVCERSDERYASIMRMMNLILMGSIEIGGIWKTVAGIILGTGMAALKVRGGKTLNEQMVIFNFAYPANFFLDP